MSPCRMVRKLNSVNLVFFIALPLIALIGLPWYAAQVGISCAEWTLFWVFVAATGLSITVGYHRLFAHRAFEANPLITFFSLVFGAAAFEQSALMWASQHRDHHRFVDTPQDPYSIKKGFWYAHIGWLIFWEHETDYSNVNDLSADPLIAHQHRYYLAWAVASGVLLPLAIGAATGHLLGAFLLAVAGRLTLVHHSTFSINSFCHTFGRATYDINATARDHWLVALLTNGEGYHNFHHRFASDYRNGVRWYQWDPSKWIILFLSSVGLARKLYRVPSHRILAAKLRAERLRVEQELAREARQETNTLLEAVRERYARLKVVLLEWERWEAEYRRVRALVSEKSESYRRTLREKAGKQRRAFRQGRRQWIAFINTNPLIPRTARI